MFIKLKLKKIKISPTKINKYLNQIKNTSCNNILINLKFFPLKISFLLKRILFSKIFTKKYNFINNNFILIQTFANRSVIYKKINPKAKGRISYIYKKLSNLYFYFCSIQLYKTYNFIKLIV
jgi:ribosomal protein L22